MPTATVPSYRPVPAGLRPMAPRQPNSDLNRIALTSANQVLQRRTSVDQGRGLEILGHAIEYLIDSRMFLIDEPHTAADSEATQILMRLSRQIFHDRTDDTSPGERLKLWFAERLRTPAA